MLFVCLVGALCDESCWNGFLFISFEQFSPFTWHKLNSMSKITGTIMTTYPHPISNWPASKCILTMGNLHFDHGQNHFWPWAKHKYTLMQLHLHLDAITLTPRCIWQSNFMKKLRIQKLKKLSQKSKSKEISRTGNGLTTARRASEAITT